MNSEFVKFNGNLDEGIPCIWLLQFEMGYYQSLTMKCIIPMTSVKVQNNAVPRLQSTESQLKELKLINIKDERGNIEPSYLFFITNQIDYIKRAIIQKIVSNRQKEINAIIANLEEEIAKLQNGGKRIRKSRKKCKSRKIRKSQRKCKD